MQSSECLFMGAAESIVPSAYSLLPNQASLEWRQQDMLGYLCQPVSCIGGITLAILALSISRAIQSALA